jgi:hypothetical protein
MYNRLPVRPGDTLWVRETWRTVGVIMPVVEYKATFPHDSCVPWKPSIHMPRWASRITQKVVGVRAERLQDITEEDAKAEGVDTLEVTILGDTSLSYRMAFEVLWDSIYAKCGMGWEVNPWVFVEELEVAEVRK